MTITRQITSAIESPKTALIVGMSAVAIESAGMGYGLLTGAGLTAIAYVGSLFERRNGSRPTRPIWEEPALVIGLWRPGVRGKITTVAMDYDVVTSISDHLLNPNYVPDFQSDFFGIPNKVLGERKYSRIVFQGVCPIARAMGGRSCSAEYQYQKSLDPQIVAKKLCGLISKNGGHVFLRLCDETADENGIVDKEKREEFIRAFEKEGFELVDQFHAPLRLAEASPGKDIPDPRPLPSKWESRKGGMIFFKRAYSQSISELFCSDITRQIF